MTKPSSGYKIEPEEPTKETTVQKITCTVTNIRITERTARKTWVDSNDEDGLRPANVTLILKGDGVVTRQQTISATDNWQFTFTRLQKYTRAGTEIDYTIEEKPVPTSYVVHIDGMNVTNTRYINISVKK